MSELDAKTVLEVVVAMAVLVLLLIAFDAWLSEGEDVPADGPDHEWDGDTDHGRESPTRRAGE